MNIFEAVFLGIVQGFTEFLPVSSSGHLAIFEYVFGLTDVGLTFDVLLHVGTLIAVIVVYYKDIIELIKNTVIIIISIIKNIIFLFTNIKNQKDISKKKDYLKLIDTPYKRFVVLIIISTIPVGFLGVLLNDFIENLSNGLVVPGICLLITGVILLIAETVPGGKKNETNMKKRNAILIGCAQAFAILPGVSRSGSTLTAALVCGLERSFAVKYSFIMSIPAILGAAVFELKDISSESLSGGQMGIYFVGMVVAAVVGFFAIKTMLVIVKNKKLKYFSYYCFAAGLFAIIANVVISV